MGIRPIYLPGTKALFICGDIDSSVAYLTPWSRIPPDDAKQEIINFRRPTRAPSRGDCDTFSESSPPHVP